MTRYRRLLYTIKSAYQYLDDTDKRQCLLKPWNITAIQAATEREYNRHRQNIYRVLEENHHLTHEAGEQ